MKLRTLGGLRLEGTDFSQHKPLLLLSYLALEGPQQRRYLAELFWPRGANPLKNLTTILTRLRKGLGDALGADKSRVWVNMPCDAQDLLKGLETSEASDLLDSYEGMFLAGFHVRDLSIELEEWVYATREFIAHQVRQALLNRAENTVSKNPLQASHYAKRAYQLHGATEPSPEQYQQFYTLFRRSKSPYTEEVKKEAESFGIELKDAGLVNILEDKNAGQQAQPTHSARAKLENKVKHNLPEKLTSFVGRSTEVLELRRLFEQDDSRLLTLLGAGGIGKTRLALQVLNEVLEDSDFTGLYFIALETLRSQDDIYNAMMVAFGLKQQAEQDLFIQLQEYLRDKNYVLVLDNFEHLVNTSAFLPKLLQACASLKIIITSRERLNLTGELVYPMGGLDVP